MKDFPKHKELEFKKLKIEWEHHRATIFNYAIGLITILIFGLKYLVIDMIYSDITTKNILAIIFSPFIGAMSFIAILIIFDRMKKVKKIKKQMKKMIEESKK